MEGRRLRHGASVVYLNEDIFLVEQTKFSDGAGRYLPEHSEDGEKISRRVKARDDHSIAAAIRDALAGQLRREE